MKKVLFGMFLSLIAVLSFGCVNAEEVVVEVPTVVMSVPTGSTDNYYVTLERSDAESPMPSSQSSITLTITGSNEGKFGSITYDKEGLYKYKIYQTNMSLENIKYDTVSYEYLVQITREEGGVLKSSTALKKQGTEEKSTVALFSNLAKAVDSGDNKKIAPAPVPKNPFTGDKIVKYFIISIISIILILLIIIYVKNSKDND